jgi:phenylacetate-CoA ligase
MIFQYNPSEFFVESNADDELLVTICRPNYVAPKVRYNIHDKGHVMRFAELRGILASHGIQVGEMCSRLLDLPVMFHYGRSDLSVAYYGCKIAPADVQEAIFQVPAMADAVSNFQLQTHEDIDGDKRLTVHVECSGQLPKCRPDDLSRSFFAALAAVNQDFRESRRMVPAGKAPAMMLHCAGEGPFANCKDLIKRQYIDARNAATC